MKVDTTVPVTLILATISGAIGVSFQFGYFTGISFQFLPFASLADWIVISASVFPATFCLSLPFLYSEELQSRTIQFNLRDYEPVGAGIAMLLFVFTVVSMWEQWSVHRLLAKFVLLITFASLMVMCIYSAIRGEASKFTMFTVSLLLCVASAWMGRTYLAASTKSNCAIEIGSSTIKDATYYRPVTDGHLIRVGNEVRFISSGEVKQIICNRA